MRVVVVRGVLRFGATDFDVGAALLQSLALSHTGRNRRWARSPDRTSKQLMPSSEMVLPRAYVTSRTGRPGNCTP